MEKIIVDGKLTHYRGEFFGITVVIAPTALGRHYAIVEGVITYLPSLMICKYYSGTKKKVGGIILTKRLMLLFIRTDKAEKGLKSHVK